MTTSPRTVCNDSFLVALPLRSCRRRINQAIVRDIGAPAFAISDRDIRAMPVSAFVGPSVSGPRRPDRAVSRLGASLMTSSIRDLPRSDAQPPESGDTVKTTGGSCRGGPPGGAPIDAQPIMVQRCQREREPPRKNLCDACAELLHLRVQLFSARLALFCALGVDQPQGGAFVNFSFGAACRRAISRSAPSSFMRISCFLH